MALTREQISLIHVGKARLGLDDDAYRALIERVAGVRSSTALDFEGFARVLEEYRRLGFESDAHKEAFGERLAHMMTAAEVYHARKLWRRAGYGGGGNAELDRWLRKHFGIAALRFATRTDGRRIIGALERMVANQAKRRARGAEAGS